jgi:hypothetical protein
MILTDVVQNVTTRTGKILKKAHQPLLIDVPLKQSRNPA